MVGWKFLEYLLIFLWYFYLIFLDFAVAHFIRDITILFSFIEYNSFPFANTKRTMAIIMLLLQLNFTESNFSNNYQNRFYIKYAVLSNSSLIVSKSHYTIVTKHHHHHDHRSETCKTRLSNVLKSCDRELIDTRNR